MKRIIVFCFLLASFIFMYGQFENAVITVSEATVETGDTFEIEVSTTEVLDEWDVIAFQFDMGFDNTLIGYNSVSLGEVPGPANLIANEYEPGIVRVAYANFVQISGTGTLVTLSFTALASGETGLDIFDFKYNSTFLNDENQIDGNVLVTEPNPFSDVVITVDSPEAGLDEAFDLAIFTSELTSEMGGISFQFELTYDNSMMSFTGGYALGDVPGPGNLLANETEPGVIAVAYANVMPITGAGSLCTLEFMPEGTEGTAQAGLTNFRYNSSFLTNLNDGTITFIGGPQEVEITKDIVSGWNWFSVNVIGEDMGVNSVLASIGDSGANIKNQSQSAIYYAGAGWFGSLNTINNTSLYKLEATSTASLGYTGVPVDLEATTYSLNSGWNWISYAPQESEAINYALEGLENGANIKNQSQSAIYYQGAGWFGSLNTMYPTAGYMLQMNDAEQHNYPEPEADFAAMKEEEVFATASANDNTQYRTPQWTVNPPDFEYNGFIWGVVEVDGVQVDDVNDWIGCFVGEECRGLAEQNFNNSVVDYTVPFGHVAFMPMVYSNVTSGETISFKYYDASEDMEYDVVSTVDWSADMVVGGGTDPFIFDVSTQAPVEPHFETVWTGDPVYPHNITVVSALVNGAALEAGDEIAVFDVDGGGAEICVGIAVVEGDAPYAIAASWDSYLTPTIVDGYVIGHEVIYKIWDASAQAELTEITDTPIAPWNGLYEFQGETQVVLEAGGGNLPPVADAGEDQTVTEGETVQLDGSGSYDPDGEAVREAPDWVINPADYEYNGSLWGIVELDGVEVTETTGWLGCFVGEECRGIASEQSGSVLDYTVPFGHTIFLPMIYSNVTQGETITFKYWDAASDAIYDIEETIDWQADMVVGDGFNPFVLTVNTMPTSDLEFLWTNTDGIIFDDATSIMPTFTAPDVSEDTDFVISLIVSDGETWSEPDEVVITVENGNIPPIANAGEDQVVIEGELVQLDGTASFDPDGDVERETPDWTINPADYEYNGSVWGIVELDGVEVEATTGILGCFVGDECRGIASEQSGSVLDYTVPFGHTIFLPMVYSNVTQGETLTFKYWDAASSAIYDIEETIDWQADMVVGDGFNPFVFSVVTIVIPDLDFAWTAPEGIMLSDPASAIPTFIAPEVTTETPYVFSLVVSDGEVWSAPDEVTIIVQNGNEAPEIALPESFMFDEDMTLEVDFAAEGYISDPNLDPLTLTVEDNELIDVAIDGSVVLFSAGENWNGSEQITFIVSDNVERLSASDDVMVVVNSVNDAPTFIYSGTITFAEDNSLAVNFSEYIDDVDGDELEMYVNGTEHVVFSIDGFEITFSAEADWNGMEEVVIGVSDNQGREVAEVNVAVVVEPVNDAPVLELPEFAEIDEDTQWEFDVTPYSSDVDNDVLSVSNISIYDGTPGWEFSYEGMIVYITPPADFAENVEIRLTVTDNVSRETAEDMMWLNVLPVNDAPTIELPEMLSFEEDGMLEEDFAAYIEDIDSEMLMLEAIGNEAIIVDIDGLMVSFSAEENWNGMEYITFMVYDEYDRLMAEDIVTVEVVSINDLPVAITGGPYSAQASAEGIAEVELSGSESYDIDGEIISWEWTWDGGSGSGETILAEFGIGETVVTLTVTDNEDGIDSSETAVVVTEYGNIAPIAMPDEFTGFEDDFLAFDVLYNDEDPDNYPEAMTVEIITDVSNGILTEQYTGFYNYVPEENWNGEDFFTYRAYDGMAYSAEVQVSLTIEAVNDAPEQVMDLEDLYLEEDFSAFIINLEEYFVDIDTEELIYNVGYNPEEIMLMETRGGIYELTSVMDWNGEALITVNVSDGEFEIDTQFTVFVEAVNDAPEMELPEILSFEEDGMLIDDFAMYIVDIDSEMLILEAMGNDAIVVDIDGLMVTFTAEENWNGTEDITFMVYDEDERLMAEDIVAVEVTPVNDAPAIELPEMLSFDEDSILEEDFAAYIEDIDSEMLYLEAMGNEAIMVDIDGLMVTFSTEENWNGSEEMTFMVYDEYERLMAEDMVIVEVVSINDNPVAEANGPYFGQADEDGNATIMLDGSGSYDIDGEVVNWEWTWEGGMTSGELVEAVFPTGEFEVELLVTDNEGGFASDMAMVTVTGYVNIPPVAVADAFAGDEDTEIYGNVLYNDYDEDQYPEAMIAEQVTDVAFGTLLFNEDGEFEYIPVENWFGMDSFEYRVFDGLDYSDPVLVELTVNPVNDSPVLVEDIEAIYLEEDFAEYEFDISGNFADVDEDELNYNIAFAAEEVLLVNLGEGMFALQSIENWYGESILEVTVSDAEYAVETSIMVYVSAVNDEPEIDLPEVFTMDEGETYEVDFAQYVSDIDEDELLLTVTGNENISVAIEGLMVGFDSPEWYGEEVLTFTINDNMGRAIAEDMVTVVVRPALFEAMITVSSDVVLEEEHFMVSVSTSELYDYWNVISFEFDLSYAAESFEYVGYSAGEVPNANGMLLVNNPAPGIVAVAYANAMPTIGEGELLTFEFMATSAGITEVDLNDFRYNSTVIENIVPGVIEVIDVNHPPVADAGDDIAEYEMESVILDGSGSYDPDNQDITYLWTAPEGIELDDSTIAMPSFITPEVTENTDFVITLTVSDGEYEDSDEMVVTVINFNHEPEANAGEDQTVEEGDVVQLDGSMSFDEDNDALSYMWTVPAGIFLDNAEGPYPVFVAPAVDEDTDYEIMLTVSDGEYEDSDEMIVTVLNAEIPEIDAEITVTSGTGQPGEPIDIEVVTSYIDSLWNIFSYEFFLAYDESQLSLDGWSLDGTIVNPEGILEVEFLRGVVNIKFVSQVSSGGREFIPIEGEGSLINLEFTSLTGGQATFDIYDFVFNAEDIDVVLPGVINNNTPYIAIPIPEQVVFEDFEEFTLDLNTFVADIDNDELTYTVESGEGIVTEINDNLLNISSVENYHGESWVSIVAWDGYSDYSQVTTEFNVVVTPVNDVPVIELPEELTFMEDGSLEVDFAPYISDIDGDDLTLTAEENEFISVEIDGSMVLLGAEENYFGTEVVTFMVEDGNRAMTMDEVSIIVTSVNDLPVAEAGAPINAVANPQGVATVALNAEESYDIDGEIVEYYWHWDTGEAYGETAEVELEIGNYSIMLTVTDNEGGMDEDMVQVSVMPYGGSDPIAYPDEYTVDEDMVLSVGIENGVLFNDIDDGYPEGLTAILTEDPVTGTLTFAEDGSFEYIPPANWYGETTFEYVAYDGAMISNEVAVLITVTSVNDLPVANAEGPYEGVAGINGMAMITLSGSAQDIDGEIVLYEWFEGEELIGTGETVDVEFGVGIFEVTLRVTDNEGGIGEATAEVTVSGYENIAPVAEDDYYTVDEDNMLTIDALEGVLANDYDPDAYPEVLSCVLVEQRDFVLNADGSFEYMPEENFNGSVYFEYYVTDGELMSNAAMIYIDVIAVNDAPEMELPEEVEFAEDEILVVDFAEYITDIDSEFLTLSVEGNLMVSVEMEGFMVTFGAESDWSGSELLTFTISDNEARLSTTGDVNVVVTAVNDAPVINSYEPAEEDITIYDNTVIEFIVNAEDIDSELAYSWTLNGEVMPIIGNIFTPEFIEVGDFAVVVSVSDEEYTEDVSWAIHYVHAPDWQIVSYDNLTTAYGYVTVDGLAADEGDMIGAFVGEECRGMGTIDGTARVNFNIFGDEVEIVNFKFWDEATDTVYDLEYFTQTYPGGEIGSIEDPLPLAVSTGVGPGWVPVIYTNSTIVYAIVSIEGEDAQEGDIVAAFAGDECRSVTEVQLMSRTAVASMVVQGEEIETIHFRIWDSSADEIYNVATTIQSNPGGVVGYPPNEILLNGSNSADVTQTFNLSGGWNLISLNVRAVDMSVESIFEPIMDNLHKVKDIHGSYDPSLPPVYNTLTELEDGAGYYVKVTGVSTLDVTGIALDPEQTPIDLSNGWNLVAYVNQTAMPVEVAFAELIDADVLHKVKNIFASFDPGLPAAYNTLVNMEPGKGYYVKVTEDVIFNYPLPTRVELESADKLEDAVWEPVVYTNSMIAYVQVALEDAQGMILGSFVDNECRGITRIGNYDGINIASLVINSEMPETVEFRIYDPETEVVYECHETITTDPGEDYSGIPTLTVTGGEEDNVIIAGISEIYPNPFNPETSISYNLESTCHVEIKVFNIKGQLVKTLVQGEQIDGNHVVTWNGENEKGIGCTSGVYFIRLTAGTFDDVQKAILMK